MSDLLSLPGDPGPPDTNAPDAHQPPVPENAIAIVGMALRFPGDIVDEEGFWRALLHGADLVTQVPGERWATDELRHPRRAEPGRSITFAAGVLSDVEGFDAAFFGISPREAGTLDPQQRLMLELAWEALENGGQRPSRLAGSDTAVYVGLSSLDNGMRGLDDLATMSAHAMTGNTLSIVANRISYVFDLHGPSLALDSACSSSLVAVHQACASLRAGEASAAFAGGVNLLLHPYSFVGFTKASMLASGERCRAFDADGDGYVRAEGGAMLFLKRARDAIAAGDPIQALILASATNTDGARKTGLTIPSGAAQAELMRRVLERSGIAAAEVDFVEAHGTGTPVGDPIEAAAIGAVYGQARSAQAPLPIGSVKTNLGHLEPVSGLAGLLKAVLALQHRTLPASLHLHRPNPHIDFEALNLAVVTRNLPLHAAPERPLRAGVNSFGFGGANAHVLLQEMRAPRPAAPPPPGATTLVLSARSESALRELAARYAALLADAEPRAAYDLAHAAATRRDRLPRRLAIAIESPHAAAAQLTRFARGEPAAAVVCEDALPAAGGLAFVYSGNGAQWLGMGRRLCKESPRFRAELEGLEALLRAHSGLSILAELHAEAEASRLDDTLVAQPLLFALQVATTLWLRERGIVPDAVVGHSVGEVAAAWAAGALDLEQAARLICARSAAQATTRGAGRMAVLALSEAQAGAWLQTLRTDGGAALDIEIAGVNAPASITLSGSLADLQKIGAEAQARGVYFRLLDLDYAFHSRHMEAIREPLAQRLAELRPCAGVVDFVSSVTGASLGGRELDAHYWWRNVREPVRFAAAVAALAARGCRVFVEIGPEAILQRYLSESLGAADIKGRVLATLRRGDDGEARLGDTALRVGLLADTVDLRREFPVAGRPVRLPNYPWQRERHLAPLTPEAHALIQRRRVHPLLGWRLSEAEVGWENTLDPLVLPWLADHRVGAAAVFPAAGFIEMALAAVRAWRGDARIALEQVAILAPLVFDQEQARVLRVCVDAHDGGIRMLSRPRLSDADWTLHATARALDALRAERPRLESPTGAVEVVEREAHYRLARTVGLDYGPAFQGIRRARIAGPTLETEVEPPEAVRGTHGYLLHPALLDLCFQSFVDLFHADLAGGRGSLYLPIQVGRVDWFGAAPVATIRARLRRHSARALLADFELLDATGDLVARVSSSRSRTAPVARRDDEAPAVWRMAARLRPHPLELRMAPTPAAAALLSELREEFADEPADGPRRAWYRHHLPLLEALTLALLRDAFAQALRFDGERTRLRLESDGGPAFWRWAARCLRQEALLECDEGQWRLQDDGDLPAATELWRELWRDAPHCAPQLALLARIARDLPALLAGDLDGAAWHRALWRSPLLEARYAHDPAYRGTHRALLRALRALAAQWPAGRRLRVLELGSGAALARAACGEIAQDRLDYALAIDDEPTRERLRIKTQDLAGPTLLGAAPAGGDADWRSRHGGFDVVVVQHALHRAHDPQRLLAELRAVLAPGGLLLAAERHADWHCDLLEGSDPAWWREADDGVPRSALRTPEAWRDFLQAAFEDLAVFTEPAAAGLHEGAYLLLARRPASHASAPAAAGGASWCLFADEASAVFAARLCERLLAQAQSARVCLAPEHDGSTATHYVYLRQWSRAPDQAASACADLLACQRRAANQENGAQLWVIARGGAPGDGVPTADPVQAALWGLGRVAMNECPALACTLIDLGGAASDEVPETLLRELLFPDGADEIVLDGPKRYQLRWEPATEFMAQPEAASSPAYRLDFRATGQLRHLQWKPLESAPLRAHEVEVRPRAVGLNFRDVMYAMGLLPEEAVENGFAGASLGLEFAGVVERVGAQVRDVAPGDAVLGFGPACFASRVTTRRDAIAALPPGWSFEAAATVPTAFFTAWYALKQLADLQPGERVLIHGAAGGVGLAAIQIAQHLGAEVFATAGSEEKRELLRWLGATQVFDSRRPDFADELLAATAGEGVDAVLNSLSGETVRRSLQVLRPFGRFLELGKRDFYENTRIGLRPLRDNIAYHGIDADRLLVERPALAARMFDEVMRRLRDGIFTPLPHRVFEADRVVDAFRTMQQARHVGKLVLSLERAPSRVEGAAKPAAGCLLGGTWLVAGGLAGFGLATAQWLAQRGARHLVLLGRRGLATPGANEAVATLRACGVEVWAEACDVSDREALSALLARMRAQLPPLTGVLHAAMSIDDGLLADLDAARLDTALRPKLLGAWHLHELTRGDALRHFVLYSSVTAWLGSPGQGNYVAANAALEALARARRAQGLPATCLAWGPIEDAGFLARNESLKDGTRRRMGAAALGSAQALRCLEAALRDDASGHCVADFDWPVLARLLPSARRPRFDRLNALPADEPALESGDFRAWIQGKPEAEVFERVRGLVREDVARILCLAVDRVEPQRSLHEAGMDSLMAVELAYGLEQRFGFRLPVMSLNEGPSVDRIARRITAALLAGADAAPPGADHLAAVVVELARQHGETAGLPEIDALRDATRRQDAGEARENA
jgi:phthiocerol/phenolphthiocerol synthesis type-I polyketide synthase C